jgi:hypothetical protein
MSKQTAVEWLECELKKIPFINVIEVFNQAKAMESKQLFLASNTSAKDAYKAGQETMSCGCYQISDATTYEEWLYEQFKNTEVTNDN